MTLPEDHRGPEFRSLLSLHARPDVRVGEATDSLMRFTLRESWQGDLSARGGGRGTAKFKLQYGRLKGEQGFQPSHRLYAGNDSLPSRPYHLISLPLSSNHRLSPCLRASACSLAHIHSGTRNCKSPHSFVVGPAHLLWSVLRALD